MGTSAGVIGTDGIVPIYNPENSFRIYNKSELYDGSVGQGRYIPNVGDWVAERNGSIAVFYYVYAVDDATKLSTLKVLSLSDSNEESTTNDRLIGIGPGTDTDMYRVYIDKSVTPYTMAVDTACLIRGESNAYCKIYKGTDLIEANVISAVYDSSNTLIGTRVPLELAQVDGNNISVKVVPVCKTSADLGDGELVTVAIFSDQGHLVYARILGVKNTAFIRSANAEANYITGIGLKGPFVSTTDTNLIKFPLNVPLSSMNLKGVVYYKNGNTVEMPIDGVKFQIFGFDNFLSTIVGQELDIVIKYALADDEICYDAQNILDKFVTSHYKAQVLKYDGQYGVKLFGYPTYLNAVDGYKMTWWMYNLDRSIATDVTSLVRIDDNSPGFKPIAYGVSQALNVNINLANVNSAYTSYKYTQTLQVTLLRPATEAGTLWTVGFSPTQSPPYGVGNKFNYAFVNQNLKRVDLSMGLSSQTDWIKALYEKSLPLYNPNVETQAPTPNYFAVVIGSIRTEYKISEWAAIHVAGAELSSGQTVFIQFFYRNTVGDTQLAVAGVPAIQS